MLRELEETRYLRAASLGKQKKEKKKTQSAKEERMFSFVSSLNITQFAVP